MITSHCPDCRNELKDRNMCSCGWIKIQDINPYQCRYIENQRRCSNEGTMSKKIRGNTWYCGEHHDK